MKKIKDLVVGETTTITMVLKSAEKRLTKTKKDFLACEFFDGVEAISGMFWDYTGDMPKRNTVFIVSASVAEWQGTKQLNVKGLSVSTDVPITEFMPSSGSDTSSVYAEAYALMGTVKDYTLRSIALEVLECMEVAWLTAPGAKIMHHAFVAGNLIHSLSVAKISGAIASECHAANYDLCIVGGMLHDLGKLDTYIIDGIVIDMTDAGQLEDHIVIGIKMLEFFTNPVQHIGYDHDVVELLRHIILSHHGVLEFGSPVTPKFIEAVIVNHADGVDAKVQMIVEASKTSDKWTAKIYPFNNQPVLSIGYVQNVLARGSDIEPPLNYVET